MYHMAIRGTCVCQTDSSLGPGGGGVVAEIFSPRLAGSHIVSVIHVWYFDVWYLMRSRLDGLLWGRELKDGIYGCPIAVVLPCWMEHLGGGSGDGRHDDTHRCKDAFSNNVLYIHYYCAYIMICVSSLVHVRLLNYYYYFTTNSYSSVCKFRWLCNQTTRLKPNDYAPNKTLNAITCLFVLIFISVRVAKTPVLFCFMALQWIMLDNGIQLYFNRFIYEVQTVLGWAYDRRRISRDL